jgi:cell division protease FtsH
VAKKIDDEVRRIVDEGYERATEVLTKHKDRLTELAEALVAKETIEADEFEAMFADLPDPRKDPGGSPTPKLATPLMGLGTTREDKPPATGDTPEPSPSPA